MTRDADQPVEAERVAGALVAVLLSLGLLGAGAFVVVWTERASDARAAAPTARSSTATATPGEPAPVRVAPVQAIVAPVLPGSRAIVPVRRALGHLHRDALGRHDGGLAQAAPP